LARELAIPTPGAAEFASVAFAAHYDKCAPGLGDEAQLVADLLRVNKIPLDPRLKRVLDACAGTVAKPRAAA